MRFGSALVALVSLIPAAGKAQAMRRIAPEPMAVRFVEGSVHGFLDLRTADGTLLANGDLVQVAKGSGIEIRMIFHFPDGSLFDEAVHFTQQRVFALQSYHLIQRGPAFTDDIDASLLSTGAYDVKSKAHHDGEEKRHTGIIEMAPDVSNGLIITLLKNLSRHDTQTVHIVAFTPEPRMVQLELAPVAERQVINGKRPESATEFVLKPRLGGLTGFFAKLLGKLPPDSHAWIVTQDAPAFVRFEGPLYLGPVWRIDLSSPHWPH